MTKLFSLLAVGMFAMLGLAACGTLDPQIKQALANYEEVTYKGRIYVVGTAGAASKVKNGELPERSITKIGWGPNRETVIFEVDSEGNEFFRIEEFKRKYNRG